MAFWLWLWITILVAGFIGIQPVSAETHSSLLNYHRNLTDLKTGEPLNGNFSVSFSIYKTPTGKNPLWKETQWVSIYEGSLNVLLGSKVPLSEFPGGVASLFSEPRWIGVTVSGEKEGRPRDKIFMLSSSFPKDPDPCPDDMVLLGNYCMDRHQNTNGLTWYGAADFCHLQGKRLCSMEEWLEACDGSPINGVEDMPGRQSQWVDRWVYETSTEVFDALERGFFRCRSFSRPWSDYRPLEKKWFRCCETK